MNPPKGKTKTIFAVLALTAAAILLATLILPGGFGTDRLYRGGFETVKEINKKGLYLPGFNVFKEPGSRFVTIQFKGPKHDRCFTLKGSILISSGGRRRLKLKAPAPGRYIMDFFCFYPVQLSKRAVASLKIGGTQGEPAVLTPLTPGKSWKRYQVKVDIKKHSQPLFNLEGHGILLFSEPVFYRAEDYEPKKRLVFVISVDTLRYDHVGVYNPAKRCTPAIDALARDAVVFRNAYSSSSWTLPAHVSLFTGTFAHRHDLNYKKKRGAARFPHSLFSLLQEKYITVSFNGGVFLSYLFGFAGGFDIYHEARNETTNPEAAKMLFHRTRKFLEKDRYKAPTLFFLHTYQVHSRFHPERELAKEYFKDTPYKYDYYEILDLTQKGRDQYKKDVSPAEREEIIKTYDAGIYTFDRRFGQFLDFLKERGLYHDALIVLLSDHGEAFMDHGGWEHGHTLYNELIRIPLLVKFPGNKQAGRDVKGLVSIVDVLPTLLDLEDIPSSQAESEFDGKSLLAAINREKGSGARSVISYLAPYACSQTPMKTAIVSGEYKFIFNGKIREQDIAYFLTPPPPVEQFELYDLAADPGEEVNVKNSRKTVFSRLFKRFRSLKLKKSTRKFPKKIRHRLKQLGYLN